MSYTTSQSNIDTYASHKHLITMLDYYKLAVAY